MINDQEHFKIFSQLEGNDIDLGRNKAYISTILSPSTATIPIKEYFDKFDFIKSKQPHSIEIAKNIKKFIPNTDLHKTNFKFDFNRLNIEVRGFAQNKSEEYTDCSCTLITGNQIQVIDQKLEQLKENECKNKNNKINVNEITTSKNADEFQIKDQGIEELKRNEPNNRIRKYNFNEATNPSNIPKQSKLECKKTDDVGSNVNRYPDFITSKQKYIEDMKKKGLVPNFNTGKKTLGGKVTVVSKFNPPWSNETGVNQKPNNSPTEAEAKNEHPKLRNIEPDMIERINSEILEIFQPVAWDDIAALDYVKSTVKEAVVLPMLRPDLFTGLRKPPRGILLFGPPGTGKTLIGKCIASQSKSTFFSISASSLTSKWIGDGEKMIRTLFAVAAARSPSVIFIDEIDSLLSQRSETEHESSRRMKTEFLVQLDGAGTSDEDRILIVGATNRPQELDEAARRRLVRRLYIPLPESEARIQILQNLCNTVKSTLTFENYVEIANMTEGFSGADMKTLCSDASMEPLRNIPFNEIENFDERNLRSLNFSDFQIVLKKIRPSVSTSDLQQYIEWDKTYGSGNR